MNRHPDTITDITERRPAPLLDDVDFRKHYRWSGMRQVGARKVVTRSKKTTKGVFASLKMQAQIPYESVWEMRALNLFEVDPSIKEIYAQPEEMRLKIDGVSAKHVPDFRLVRPVRDCLVEVKEAEEAAKGHNTLKFEAAREEAARRSLDYLVLTEKEIMRQPRHDNTVFLLRYASRWMDEDVAADLIDKLIEGPKTADVLVAGELRRWQILAGLIARCRASIDWWAPFNSRTLVHLVRNGVCR